MLRRLSVCLVLFTATSLAATSDFLLGLNFTAYGPDPGTVRQIAEDGSGNLYILSFCTTADSAPSCLTKLSADGKTILWQNNLASNVPAMAVDPGGGVYLLPQPVSNASTSSVPQVYPLVIEKLSPDGTAVLWQTQLNNGATGYDTSLAVDSTGRAFVAGSLSYCLVPGACVVRLNAAGAVETTFANLPLEPTGIAVDPTGSYIAIASAAYPAYKFVRLTPNAANWVALTPPLGTISPGMAIASNGDAVVYGSDLNGNRSLQRIDLTGAVVFSKSVPSLAPSGSTNAQAPGSLALDATGNAYITGYTGPYAIPTRNSLAPCGSSWLSVYAPDGTILQTTYLPGATSTPQAYPLLALGPGAAAFVLAQADSTFTPAENGPFPAGSSALFNLSSNPAAQTLPLACAANSAAFTTGAIAPGELISLFGNGLGPLQGVQTSATLQTPFPYQAAGVQVTFNGLPAPLTYVQDSQINVAVPWLVTTPLTQICVTYGNVSTNCLAWPTNGAAPGVFTPDGIHAAAINQDGSQNSASNPAPPNSIVSVFATGLGPVSPPEHDGSLVGLPLPVNTYPVTLELPQIVGMAPLAFPVPTTYAGPAPFLISGASQINFNTNDIPAGQPNSVLYLMVATPAGSAVSNSFRIYVAGQ